MLRLSSDKSACESRGFYRKEKSLRRLGAFATACGSKVLGDRLSMLSGAKKATHRGETSTNRMSFRRITESRFFAHMKLRVPHPLALS